jgi:hypothetical protein
MMGCTLFHLQNSNTFQVIIGCTLFHLQNSTTFQLMMGCALFVHNIQRLFKQGWIAFPFGSQTLKYFPQQ